MAEGALSGSHYFALPAGSKLYEFEIEAVLGHGGFGITYRATDTLLQGTVAIKEFLPNEVAVRISDATVRAKSQRDQSDFETGLKSFLEEARVMARFHHPRIVHVRRFFELHGTGYIVLDYEHGQTLSERLGEDALPEAELRGILSGVLDGLEVIHDRAILHRDLKPNNIMLREDGAPVIIDFGAARDFQARHSRSVTAIATAGYAPPEQYGVGGQQGPWSDLYALGAIAYRAVSGETPIDSLRRLRSDPLVPAVSAGAGKYDEALLRTIDWMLKIDEADRPASVAQVREALRGGPIPIASPQTQASRPISDNGPVVARPGGADLTPALEDETLKASPPPTRRGRLAAVAGLLVLAGMAVGSYAFYANYQARQQADLQAKQQAKQQAELQVQQANERKQQQLTEQLANAGTDLTKLEQFLSACGSDCPDNLRSQARTRFEAELRGQFEDAKYSKAFVDDLVKRCDRFCSEDFAKDLRSRSMDIEREDSLFHVNSHTTNYLREYLKNCKACSFRSEAQAQIASAEEQAENRRRNTNNDVISLSAFLLSCAFDCSTRTKELAEASLKTARQNAYLQELWALGANEEKIREFEAKCVLPCPDRVRNEATQRLKDIDLLRQRIQANSKGNEQIASIEQQQSASTRSDEQYLAVAVSKNGGAWGAVHEGGYSSEEEARRAALNGCAKYARDCYNFVVVKNGCTALARAVGNNAMGASKRADTVEEARNRALESCRKVSRGRRCETVYSACANPS